MEVYFDKIEAVRKEKYIGIPYICSNLKINRSTYWRWKKGEVIPAEDKVREIAKILNVHIDKITDLPEVEADPENKLKNAAEIWNNFSLFHAKSSTEVLANMQKEINRLNEDMSNILLIVKGILTSTHIAFYIKDADLKYVAANTEFLDYMKLPASFTVYGKSDSDLMPTKESAINNDQDKKVFFTGEGTGEFEGFLPGSRNKRWGIISKLPIFDIDKRVMGVMGIFIDITERKRNENRMRLLELFAKNADLGISIREKETGKILFRNDKLDHMLGYSKDEVSELSAEQAFSLIYHKDDYKRAIQDLHSGKEGKYTYRLCKKNKEVIWAEIQRFNFLYEERNCNASIIKDITEQVKSRSQANLINIFIESSDAAVAIADLETSEVFYINPSYTKMFGHSLKDIDKLKNDKISEMYFVKEDFIKDVNLKFEEFLSGSSSNYVFETMIKGKAGRWFWVNIEWNKIFYENRLCLASVIRDIDEQKNRTLAVEVLKLSIDNCNEGILVREADTFELVYQNPAYYKLMNRNALKFISLEEEMSFLQNAMPKDDYEKFLMSVDIESGEGKASFNYKNEGVERYLSAEMMKKEIFGKMYRMYVIRDLTSLINIQKSKNKVYDIINMFNNVIVVQVVIGSNKIRSFLLNDTLETITGYKFEDLNFNKNIIEDIVNKDDFPFVSKLVDIEDGLYEYQLKLNSKRNEEIWSKTMIQVKKTSDTEKIIDAVFIDVSEEVRLKRDMNFYLKDELDSSLLNEKSRIAENLRRAGIDEKIICEALK